MRKLLSAALMALCALSVQAAPTALDIDQTVVKIPLADGVSMDRARNTA